MNAARNSHCLRIVADKNIPFICDAFSKLGSLQLFESEEITQGAVKHCDLLIIRYVTHIDRELLSESSVKLVGTVSAGTDHINIDYLKDRNIAFASAPGSNANSVAEYVIAALLSLHERGKIDIKKTTLGIIGVGNVGTKVAKKAAGLGIKVVLNDPPKYRATNDPIFRPLAELAGCDVLTIHAPLIMSGTDKTHHLFDSTMLSKLKQGAIIINSARGGIVDETALENALETGHIAGAVIDVWENEPGINRRLLELTDIGTPHIAGLSQEARLAATSMMHRAACAHFSLPGRWLPPAFADKPVLLSQSSLKNSYLAAASLVKLIYDIGKDSSGFKRDFPIKDTDVGAYFTAFRKEYSSRREFSSRKLEFALKCPSLKQMLTTLGFEVT